MEKVLRAAFFPNSQPAPLRSCPDTVPAAETGVQPKESCIPVNGIPSQRKRKRTLYSKWQQVELESVFEVIPYPDISTREHLAKIICLPESKVQVWFQNRRARKNKSGKFNRFLYRRGSSFRARHFCWSSASPSRSCSQRDPLIPMPQPSNQSVTHGHPSHQVSSMQQSGYPSFVPPTEAHQISPPVPEQFSDESYVHTYEEQNLQWQNVTSSSEYGCDAMLCDTQGEPFTIPSQGSYWEMFPQTMNENGQQTSLGYISDVIYNAAILTNIGDV
ncbi:homeobox protein SEBOX [Phyllobates terribilis]|uniref:homeobox protein SEBOX n=1 Tax=Phyllobates terribilis TaxID=111132 RepID=UPI003CCB0FE8